MSIALDGFHVLQRLGKHSDLFVVVRADADKAARALVVKCLKSKSLGLDSMRQIQEALGGDQFSLVLEGLKDADVKSILARLDKHVPELKTGTTMWRRQHLQALAEGEAYPFPPPAKAAKTTASPKKGKAAGKAKAEPKRLQSDVMDLYREGGKRKG